MEFALEAEDLHVSFGKEPILWDVSMQIPKGLLVGILGPNGAGKSTLLKAALKLVKPLSGRIDLAEEVAYVPQRESVDWDFPITAFEVALMGRFGQLGMWRRVRRADREAALHALDLVGMAPFANRQIGKLSGGQQQKLFFARAFVKNPQVYLLDEPFAGVDLATEKSIMALLKQEIAKGKSVLVVHHDLLTVKEYFNWALLLNKRLIGCGPVDQVLTKENVERTFGKGQLLFSEAAALSTKSFMGDL